MHLREIFYGTLIFQQSSMICIGQQVGGHTLAFQHGGQNYFCFYLVKCWIVTLRCAENVATSSFQQFPWSLSAKFLFRRVNNIHSFKNNILVMWPAMNLLISRKWWRFEKLITIILFKIWPTIRFLKAKSYNFNFLSANRLFQKLLSFYRS